LQTGLDLTGAGKERTGTTRAAGEKVLLVYASIDGIFGSKPAKRARNPWFLFTEE
jgi:hypothetical protein